MNTSKKQNNLARASIKHWLDRSGLRTEEFGPIIGRSRATGFNLLRNPERITLEDLHLMNRHRKLTEQELKEIIGI